MLMVMLLKSAGTVKVKASSYITQYPVLRIAQSALYFTSLKDLFIQKPSRLLWEASSHMLQLMREGCSYTYPPLPIARYSLIQLSELEQCREKQLAQDFNTAAQDSKPGSSSQEYEILPLSRCALRWRLVMVTQTAQVSLTFRDDYTITIRCGSCWNLI